MRLTFVRPCAMLLALAALPTVLHAQTVLFSDAFDSEVVGTPASGQFTPGPVGSTGWNFVLDEPNQGDVRYGYDYSAINIPEAPNSQPGDEETLGVALRTNASAGAVDQSGIYYDDASFTGSYTVEVDMWLNWANDEEQIGTTEHAGLFVGKDTVANPANPDFPASTGAGAIYSSDGDCTNCDHILLKNSAELDTFSGQYSVTDFGFGNQQGFDNTDANTDPMNGDLLDLPAVLPAFTIPGSTETQAAGTVGYRWVTLKAEVDTNALGAGEGSELGATTFSLTEAITGNSYVLGTVDNSVLDNRDDDGNEIECEPGSEDICTDEAPVDMSGRVSLTIIDFFTSVASDLSLATVVFDNLVVTEVEQSILAGDFDGNGSVGDGDLTLLLSNWGSAVPPVPAGWTGDQPTAPGVGDDELTALLNNWGVSASAVAVPEPSTALLACLAVAALTARRRV
ncbi:hypothetical protein MalM25_31630 [Planctomycetes bacterium MalM25]|nr:hypothetical protein MalM25_31630 [Planctomycetes bacterium MalM25]